MSIMALVKYELLVCDVCGKEFTGRKPAEGGDTLCSNCIDILIVVNEGEPIPSSVYAETEGGKGDE